MEILRRLHRLFKYYFARARFSVARQRFFAFACTRSPMCSGLPIRRSRYRYWPDGRLYVFGYLNKGMRTFFWPKITFTERDNRFTLCNFLASTFISRTFFAALRDVPSSFRSELRNQRNEQLDNSRVHWWCGQIQFVVLLDGQNCGTIEQLLMLVDL